MNVRFLVAGILSITLALMLTTFARAHATTPRLEISLERVNPGGVFDLRGVGFDYEESVTLYLERPGIVVQLGNVSADTEGIFLHIAVLPVDLPEGVYNVRGVTSHHDVVSPALTVQSPAIIEGGGQGERDEDDGLLAPMPTYAPGVIPGGVSATALPQTTAMESPPSTGSTFTLAYSLFLGIAIIAFFGIRILRKR